MLKLKSWSRIVSFSFAACIISANSFAAQPGLYVGGQVGWGNVHNTGIANSDMIHMIDDALGYPNYSATTQRLTSTENGFAWRVFGGYQIGYNWAMEIGWAQVPRLDVDATASGVDNITGQPLNAVTDGIFKVGIFDFVGKYIYCLPCHFNIYGKLGLAYLTGWANESIAVSEPNLVATAEADDVTNSLYPTGSIGVSYDFRPDISMDLSYTRIQKVGNSNQLGSIDMLLLGMALHFG